MRKGVLILMPNFVLSRKPFFGFIVKLKACSTLSKQWPVQNVGSRRVLHHPRELLTVHSVRFLRKRLLSAPGGRVEGEQGRVHRQDDLTQRSRRGGTRGPGSAELQASLRTANRSRAVQGHLKASGPAGPVGRTLGPALHLLSVQKERCSAPAKQ